MNLQKEFIRMREMFELAIQQHSGGHSDMLKQIKEVKEHLENQDVKMANFEKKLDPIARAFEESENYKLVWTKTGITIKQTAGWIIMVGGAFAVLWGIIKYIGKLILMR